MIVTQTLKSKIVFQFVYQSNGETVKKMPEEVSPEQLVEEFKRFKQFVEKESERSKKREELMRKINPAAFVAIDVIDGILNKWSKELRMLWYASIEDKSKTEPNNV